MSPKLKIWRKRGKMGPLSQGAYSRPSMPYFFRLQVGRRERKEKREQAACLLITLTPQKQEKPCCLKTIAFGIENETILEYFTIKPC